METRDIFLTLTILLIITTFVIFFFVKKSKSSPPSMPGLVPGEIPGQPGLIPGQPGLIPGQPGLIPGQPGLIPGAIVIPPNIAAPGALPNPIGPGGLPIGPGGLPVGPDTPVVPPETPVTPPIANQPESIDSKVAPFMKNCVGKGGVVNIKNNSAMTCLKFQSGEVLDTLGADIVQTTPKEYLKAVYSGYSGWDQMNDSAVQKVFASLEMKYIPKITRVMQITTPVFHNTQYVEVIPVEDYFANLNRETWKGTWYYTGTGTGWFIPTNTSLLAYNSLHLLNMFGISDANVTAYASDEFKKYATGKTLGDIRKNADMPNAQIPYLGPASKSYIAQMAVQRGYKSIQLSNEFVVDRYERFFIDLVEGTYSTRNCIRKNPFAVATNPNNEALWLNAFLVPEAVLVDQRYIIDPQPKRSLGERYGDFAFKTGCRKQYGTISIADMLLDCLKIVNYGLPVNILNSEMKEINFASYPQATELEKLQSYFSIVYGSPQVWKTKDLATLQDYWKRMEMRYKLPIFPTSPYNTYPKGLNFGVAAPGMIATQEDKRPGEAMQYIEVVRQNKKFSWYQTANNFASTYYYACRGSGLFLPVGKLFIARTKQDAAASFGQTIPGGWVPEDVAIGKIALYKGFDTLLLVRYGGYTTQATEVAHLRDPITSQMSLIRTHPWDPRLQLTNSYSLHDDYFPKYNLDVAACIIQKQYEPGKGINTCN